MSQWLEYAGQKMEIYDLDMLPRFFELRRPFEYTSINLLNVHLLRLLRVPNLHKLTIACL